MGQGFLWHLSQMRKKFKPGEKGLFGCFPVFFGICGHGGRFFLQVENLFDHLGEPGHIGNDDAAATALDQAFMGERVQLAGYGLPVRADPARDFGMGRRR